MGFCTGGMKVILVTGASTGIGRRIAEHLAERGFRVLAGARKQSDIEALGRIPSVRGVQLDVTDTGQISRAVSTAAEEGGIYALVNNAGIGISRPLIEMTDEEYMRTLDVNLVSLNRMVRAFFEQLRDNQGRVVNIASLNGFIPSPFFGAYSISKFGVVAYSEQLAIELKKFKISVSCVEPGYFHSSIFEKAARSRQEIAERSRYYSEEYQEERDNPVRDANIKDPIQVAEVVAECLNSPKPRLHYAVGNRTEEGWAFLALFNRIKEVNEGLVDPWEMEELLTFLKKSEET